MIEDAELLRRYVVDRSQEAFAELVRRRVNLVYSVALRQVGGDAQLAEDVTQRVFADLARKAKELSGRAVLSGWLYRSAQFAATDVVRAERRRRGREQEAQIMNDLSLDAGTHINWEKFRPVLDKVMSELDDDDRDAVALRFFEERSFAEIGTALQLNEEAARKRVMRALDKMHALLTRRGVTSTTAALSLALANQAGIAAPAGLGAAVTVSALAGAGVGVAGAATIFMGVTKLQIGLAGLLALAGTAVWVNQARSNSTLREEAANLRKENRQIAALQTEDRRLAAIAAEIESLRGDEMELVRLREQATALKIRVQTAPQSQTAALREKTSWPNSLPIYPLNQLDQKPVAKYRATVKYPSALRSTGVTGRAVISVVVDANGDVQDAWPMSSTHHEFEVAALEAIKKWKFDAGRKAGQSVNVRVEIPFVFTLDAQSKSVRPADWF